MATVSPSWAMTVVSTVCTLNAVANTPLLISMVDVVADDTSGITRMTTEPSGLILGVTWSCTPMSR